MSFLPKLLVFILLLCWFDSVNADLDYHKEITGRWVKKGADPSDCGCGDCIDIQFGDKAQPFCVESNQIYLKVSYKLDYKLRKVYLLFDDVLEVGTGGGALPWERFDKKKPLAELDVSEVQKGRISMKWFGFRGKDYSSQHYRFGSNYAGIYERPSTE
ncbi:hypothetical protein KP005_17990 [Geomonas nitrogeniifigens]|uniref:Uncharacterized protein n=1 Tax=Geomonas diazotrophica TaxID=2843197 RepID=A0ABX8JKQ4_9BACT|nr:hypothetical protein [Geomonas nitrogeniifigens]QWV97209.1 hypothetical protein KP005_17990 [Geomonas nitrogeniifigens]